MAEPTIYPDLNAVLRELVAGVKKSLAENFHGAYLHGSFAIGDADAYSDVDFLVATHEEVDTIQLAGLRDMHQRLYEFDIPWAQHLEGSYVPKHALRHVDPARSPYLYLDSGASQLTWSDDFNTAVVRWSLREYGVALEGPNPKSLIEPVSAAQLREEVLKTMDEWVARATAPAMNRWKQPFIILSYCRMLHTLATGRVDSKREAGEWALSELHPEWTSFIQRALDDRPDPWLKIVQPADQADVERTLAFVEYAMAEASARYGPGA